MDTPEVTILLDFPIRTDRAIQDNRPDKEFGKLSKYEDLEIEIGKTWKMKTRTIAVTVGALGMIKKGAQKYVNESPGICLLLKFKK